MNYIDTFVHPSYRDDPIAVARSRTIALVCHVAITIFSLLLFLTMRKVLPFFVISYAMLFASLLLLRKGWIQTTAAIIIAFLIATNLSYFQRALSLIGLLNANLMWIITILVAAPLMGGSRVGVATTLAVLISYNYHIYGYYHAVHAEEGWQVRVIWIEWNMIVFSVSGFLIAFERFLTSQIALSKRAHEDSEVHRRNALQSSQLASLGEMAGGIAHEINNPLAIIHGNTSIAAKLISKESFEKKEAILGRLDKITQTTERIKVIIDTMRKLSRQESLDSEFSIHDIRLVVNDIEALYTEKMKNRGYQFQVDIHDGFLIECNQVLMGQVFINLLNNALDAMDDYNLGLEGWVRISCSESVHMNEPVVLIRIANAGPKLKEELVGKIMDPFFTTKQVGRGTGLGLSISTNIVNQHRGSLYLDRDHTHTCFIIRLPRMVIEHQNAS